VRIQPHIREGILLSSHLAAKQSINVQQQQLCVHDAARLLVKDPDVYVRNHCNIYPAKTFTIMPCLIYQIDVWP
jgi:hypothetical protein